MIGGLMKSVFILSMLLAVPMAYCVPPCVSSFHEMIRNGRVESVRNIVRDNNDIAHIPDENQNIALHIAVDSSQNEIVRFLLDSRKWSQEFLDSMLKSTNKDGETPLIRAVLKNNQDGVNALLDRGADTNVAKPRGTHYTPLFLAVQKGYTEIAYRLLLSGASRLVTISGRPYTITEEICSPQNREFMRITLESAEELRIALGKIDDE